LERHWTWENGGNSQKHAVIEANERKYFLKVYPRIDHEGLDGEVKVQLYYFFTLHAIWRWLVSASDGFAPQKEAQYPLYRGLGGWVPGLV